VGSIAVLVLFILLDKYAFQDWRENGRNYDNFARSAISSWPVKVKQAIVEQRKERRNPDGYTKLSDADDGEDDANAIPLSEKMAMDLYDEYESFEHECLVFIGAKAGEAAEAGKAGEAGEAGKTSEAGAVAGICLYLLDRKVEYFRQTLPVVSGLPESEASKISTAGIVSGIEMWSKTWFSAKAVRILCNDYNTVKEINSENSELNRELAATAREENFTLSCDWTENFFCETNANEELWEGVIICGKKLLEHHAVDLEEEEVIPWEELGPSENWNRTKVKLDEDVITTNIERFGVNLVNDISEKDGILIAI